MERRYLVDDSTSTARIGRRLDRPRPYRTIVAIGWNSIDVVGLHRWTLYHVAIDGGPSTTVLSVVDWIRQARFVDLQRQIDIENDTLSTGLRNLVLGKTPRFRFGPAETSQTRTILAIRWTGTQRFGQCGGWRQGN